MATEQTEQRKARDRQTRREQIVRAARQIAEREGWAAVTVRRLSDEIGYSQPVLYSHFPSRDAVVAAVAVEGFQELGQALERQRLRGKRRNPVAAVANGYLEFARASPALYRAMFTLNLSVAFDDEATPAELRFAFAQVAALFPGPGSSRSALAELFWASLHGLAELTHTGRLPPGRQKARVAALVQRFS